jgi:hypothetical protein
MRAMSCVLAMLACVASPCYSQTLQPPTPRAIYAELGGSAITYSINVEEPVAHNRTTRFGVMAVPGALAGTVSVNQLFGSGNRYLVLGGGMTISRGDGSGLTAATATLGYRYMRRGGLFFQYALTPLFTRSGIIRWSGISLGKSF